VNRLLCLLARLARPRRVRPLAGRRGRRATALVVAVLAHGGAAAAQPTSQPASPVTAGWNDGFVLQTPNGDHALRIGTVLQVDGRFGLDDPSSITDTFVLRKARPVFAGRVAKYFDFRLMPELAGSVTVLDAYFDIRFSPKLRLRSGKDKTPVGYELLLGDPYLIFPERTVVSLLVPNRDVGFQVQGDLAGGKVLYAAGVFNGNAVDGSGSTPDVDTNDGKDLAGRIVVMPFRRAPGQSHRLGNFGLHLGGSTGNQFGPLPTLRTSAGQNYFSFAATTTADGRRNRVSPALFLYTGPFGGFVEFARSTRDVVSAGVPATVTNQAWSVTGSYVLTGEPTSERGVRPRRPFDPAAGGWGAFQVAARYGRIEVDDRIFSAGMAAAGASRSTTQASVVANWFLSSNVKLYAMYERFTFTGGRSAENVIIFRTQLAF
jgi:phosphate-selective porin OprO/OprP